MSSAPLTAAAQAHEPAHGVALQRLYAVRPAWSGVVSAAEAVGLASHCLLHAGPPFAEPARPSAPVLASAALCCLHEGWAQDLASARRLILEGHVALRPAQDFNVVAPLAAVISPSTCLVEVRDLDAADRCWSLLPSGAGPQIRFGTPDLAVLERMRFRDQDLAAALQGTLAKGPMDLIPHAQAGLHAGDDLHSQTAGATAALLAALRAAQAPPTVIAVLETAPLFFLTLWMAACHLMLRATAGAGAPSLVVALAGNGQEVGIRLAGAPQRWLTRSAPRPDGPRLATTSAQPAPLLGDSGVIDAAGFGAQAWAHARGPTDLVAPWLPAGWTPDLRGMRGAHPAFAAFSLRTGLDADLVLQQACPPMVALAMIDEAAEQGLLGRGFCKTEAALFAG